LARLDIPVAGRVEEVVDARFHLCFLALEVPDLFLNGVGIEETRSKPDGQRYAAVSSVSIS
jgi:hypothetical protein